MQNREEHLSGWRFTGTLCPDLCGQLHRYFLRQPPPEGATVTRPAWKGRHRPQPPDGECLSGQRLGLESPHTWGLPPHRGLAASSGVCLRGAVVTQSSPAQPSSLGDPRLLGNSIQALKISEYLCWSWGDPHRVKGK